MSDKQEADIAMLDNSSNTNNIKTRNLRPRKRKNKPMVPTPFIFLLLLCPGIFPPGYKNSLYFFFREKLFVNLYPFVPFSWIQ